MPLWKQLLLGLYYHASRPARAWDRRRREAAGTMPIVVLYWHRVADDEANDWTVSNELFVQQIRWLQRRFRFISLEEAQRRIAQGYNAEPCVSVTFDDGYADNCDRAIPLLIEEKIPCAYFVTVQNVLEGSPFAHDLKMGRRFAPNSLEQVLAMARGGVEIGAHSYSHANLGAADGESLRREVVEAKDRLQTALGRPVRYMAFPFGQYANLSFAAFETAKQAGYAGVCSAYGGYNFPGDDPFHIQRIAADGHLIRLKNWATLDPRKLRISRFG